MLSVDVVLLQSVPVEPSSPRFYTLDTPAQVYFFSASAIFTAA